MADHNIPIRSPGLAASPALERLVGAEPLPVRTIGIQDLRDALAKGTADFWAKPSHLVFLTLIYPLAGIVLARLIAGYEILPLLYPLVAGFTLVGPFAAVGLYEISRRRERGLDTSWSHAFDVLRSPAIGPILALGGILAVIFFAWLGVAWGIYAATMGGQTPASIPDFLTEVLSTPSGWMMIILGNLAGFLFAVLVLTISVVSFPLLVDRNVGTVTAIRTSIAAVRANPVPMAVWGVIVAVSLAAGLLPFFVGLALILPILGHATWHLYRRVVV